MAEQTVLKDVESGAERVRVLEMLAVGDCYQIVRGETVDEGRPVCVKAILYEESGDTYVEGRRAALRAEGDFLEETAPVEGTPELVDQFETSGLDGEFEAEPVLVYAHQPGPTVYDLVRKETEGGLDTGRARELLESLTEILIGIHTAGWVFRNLDPRHIIVDDGEVSLVGCGNATRKSERPIPQKMPDEDNPYVAPEIRSELSGKMLRPAADAYSLGALMSFVLTGEEPRTIVENPLGHDAFERLSNLESPGLSLIIAKCIQPMAKKRFGNLKRLRPYTTEEGLPDSRTEEFGVLTLPAPFSGGEDPETNRALRSNLSDGPLISTPRGERPADGTAASTDDAPGGGLGWLAFLIPVGLIAVLGILAAFGVL